MGLGLVVGVGIGASGLVYWVGVGHLAQPKLPWARGQALEVSDHHLELIDLKLYEVRVRNGVRVRLRGKG